MSESVSGFIRCSGYSVKADFREEKKDAGKPASMIARTLGAGNMDARLPAIKADATCKRLTRAPIPRLCGTVALTEQKTSLPATPHPPRQ